MYSWKFCGWLRIAIIAIGLLLTLSFISPQPVRAQAKAPTPIASYAIQVRLDVQQKQLTGYEVITYRNATSAPIPDLVFHLYLNAFKSEDSLFMRESGGLHRGFASDPAQRGWIEVQNLRIIGADGLDLNLVEDGTLSRVLLPEAVLPGEEIKIELDFIAQLPAVFARTGWAEDARGDTFFMVGQWFPKLGVWTDEGWNAYPYHANAEFFADFGNYEVAITLPTGYTTGGTGLSESVIDQDDGTQTITYRANNVIDFAWTASPNLHVASKAVAGVELVYLYLPEHAWTVTRVQQAGVAALEHYSDWFGAYPYPRLTVVDVPDEGAAAGGMEYPTLITAGSANLLGMDGLVTLGVDRSLEIVVYHEVAHQWFQSMVATNEAEEPWLDEGFADYATVRLINHLYGEDSPLLGLGNWKITYQEMRRLVYLVNPGVPMYGKAWDFDMLTYEVASYDKPGLSLATLERILGEETMLRLVSTYFQRYQYQHPMTEDFRQVVREITGSELSWFFEGLVYGDQTLNYTVSAVEEHSATFERQGKLIIPTEVELTFAGGKTFRQTWDGQVTPLVLTFTDKPPIKKATVDPDGKLLVDLCWGDNSLRRTLDLWSWLAVVTRIVFQFQDVLLIGGGL